MQYGLETFDKNGVSNNTGWFISSGKLIYLDVGVTNAVYTFEERQSMQLKFIYLSYMNMASSSNGQYRKVYVSNNSIIVEPANKPTAGFGSFLATGAYILAYFRKLQ